MNIGSLAAVFVVGKPSEFSEHHAQPTVDFVANPDHIETGV